MKMRTMNEKYIEDNRVITEALAMEFSAGAKRLGIKDPNDPEHLAAFLEGRYPGTQQYFIRHQANAPHYFYGGLITVDPTVSATYALHLDRDQKRAMSLCLLEAAKDEVAQLDRHAFVRKGPQGCQTAPAELIGLNIVHDRNRLDNPHCHDHVIFHRFGVDKSDGVVRSLKNPSELFYQRGQNECQHLGQLSLGHQIEARLNIRCDYLDGRCVIPGIDREMARAMGGRSAQIDEYIKQLGIANTPTARAYASLQKPPRSGLTNEEVHAEWAVKFGLVRPLIPNQGGTFYVRPIQPQTVAAPIQPPPAPVQPQATAGTPGQPQPTPAPAQPTPGSPVQPQAAQSHTGNTQQSGHAAQGAQSHAQGPGHAAQGAQASQGHAQNAQGQAHAQASQGAQNHAQGAQGKTHAQSSQGATQGHAQGSQANSHAQSGQGTQSHAQGARNAQTHGPNQGRRSTSGGGASLGKSDGFMTQLYHDYIKGPACVVREMYKAAFMRKGDTVRVRDIDTFINATQKKSKWEGHKAACKAIRNHPNRHVHIKDALKVGERAYKKARKPDFEFLKGDRVVIPKSVRLTEKQFDALLKIKYTHNVRFEYAHKRGDCVPDLDAKLTQAARNHGKSQHRSQRFA